MDLCVHATRIKHIGRPCQQLLQAEVMAERLEIFRTMLQAKLSSWWFLICSTVTLWINEILPLCMVRKRQELRRSMLVKVKGGNYKKLSTHPLIVFSIPGMCFRLICSFRELSDLPEAEITRLQLLQTLDPKDWRKIKIHRELRTVNIL